MWVRPLIYLLQLRYAVVGIALRCFERGVSHKFLYITHICIVIQQVCGEGVAKYVG